MFCTYKSIYALWSQRRRRRRVCYTIFVVGDAASAQSSTHTHTRKHTFISRYILREVIKSNEFVVLNKLLYFSSFGSNRRDAWKHCSERLLNPHPNIICNSCDQRTQIIIYYFYRIFDIFIEVFLAAASIVATHGNISELNIILFHN